MTLRVVKLRERIATDTTEGADVTTMIWETAATVIAGPSREGLDHLVAITQMRSSMMQMKQMTIKEVCAAATVADIEGTTVDIDKRRQGNTMTADVTEILTTTAHPDAATSMTRTTDGRTQHHLLTITTLRHITVMIDGRAGVLPRHVVVRHLRRPMITNADPFSVPSSLPE